MFLKKIKIENFRKFYKIDEYIEFVSGLNENENIDISKITTLVIGKNNVGKTTIIEFFKKLNRGNFNSHDFNYYYLKSLLKQYKNNNFKDLPMIKSELLIYLDNENALVGAIADFLTLDENIKEIQVNIIYRLVEENDFRKQVNQILNSVDNESEQFRNFLNLIDSNEFRLEYYRKNNTKVERFKFNNLFELEIISANRPLEHSTLSNAFNKIIQFKYENESRDEIEKHIDSINETITEKIAQGYTKIANSAFESIDESKKHIMHLSGNVSFENIFQNLIRYEYIENNTNIPESQFGLGYKNLMIIISEIINFIQKYPKEEQSKVNLIFIEEPENYMHPQMQEMFIKYITEAVKSILKNSDKKINSQLIIITHSSHIVNSKIHFANSFNNIVYLYDDKSSLLKISNLKDENIAKKDENNAKKEDDFLPFLKKHVKFELSNIFFADGAIVVEGLAEEILLKYFLEDHKLKNYYITIFKIDGAHAFMYNELFKLLNIPILIIADLDIKREKDDSENIDNLNDKTTTNQTLSRYYNSEKLIDIYNSSKYKPDSQSNVYISTQIEPIEGFYATSFEEAFILTNWDNSILKNILIDLKPEKITEIIGEKYDNIENLKKESYKIQKILDGNKGNFAITLLEKMIKIDEKVEIDKKIKLPQYICNGLEWLLMELKRDEKC